MDVFNKQMHIPKLGDIDFTNRLYIYTNIDFKYNVYRFLFEDNNLTLYISYTNWWEKGSI